MNPPYIKYVASNIGKDFLNLICKYFANHSPLDKIFNQNNIKVSYICTSNISLIIKVHDPKIETHHINTHPNKKFICWDNKTFPLQGNCL